MKQANRAAPAALPPRRTQGAAVLAGVCVSTVLFCAAPAAVADEGGAGFWLPGQMGSFSALPGDPGWSLPLVYYHGRASASGGKSFPIGNRLAVDLDATPDLFIVVPTYVFSTPVAGGQAAVSMTAVLGHLDVGVDATLTGPGGGFLSAGISDSATGAGDLYPMASLKWNRGVHNFMAYTMAGVPVGVYDVDRLANLGLNHWSLDAGGGYTYLDPAKGHEFSAVLGFTHNFENTETNYQSGVDAHLDWAASQFVSEQTHIGLVGYFYHQLTGDSGSGATLGEFKSQVTGVGPEIGHFFPVGGKKWYLNFKGYYESNARNRPDGWNTWLTLAIPLSAPPAK